MYKIAICDDDSDYREIVIKQIRDLNMITNPIEFYQFGSGEDLLDSGMDFDLLFLDIQMPGKDGNEISVMFRQHNENCILIFCTNYQMPLAENFKVRPFRYIMKDIHNKVLFEELPDILLEMMEKTRECYITVTQDGELTRISIDDIMYITVEVRKSKIVCYDSNKSFDIYCREKLKELYPELSRECFEYAHSSFLVNMRKISHLDKKEITMMNGDKVYISRSKSKEFDEAFTRFLNRKYRR